MARYRLEIAKESFKFSSGHFTIFNDTEVECLHGHNYRLSVTIECRDVVHGFVIEFRVVKKIIHELCEMLDEKVLIPDQADFLSISKEDEAFRIRFHGAGFSKEYLLPCEDVELLPLANITVECLAKYLCEAFVKRLLQVYDDKNERERFYQSMISVEIRIEETPGQSGAYIWEN